MKNKIIPAFLTGIVIIAAIFAFIIFSKNKEGLTDRLICSLLGRQEKK